MDSILIKSPATVANLSCGFDILGICLQRPYDEIEIKIIPSKKIIINSIDSEFSKIPTIPNQNTGGIPALQIQSDYSLNFGFEINIKKGIPLCGGLGSSAATAAGVTYGINKLLGDKLSQDEMIKYALEGEKLSSNDPHADNIGPCLMGGLVLIKDIRPPNLIQLPIGDFYFSIIHPFVEIETKLAREVLPSKVDLKICVKQWGNIASLVYGFVSNDRLLIKQSMIDSIVEPFRSKLIPGYEDVKKSALKLGSLGCCISGSGPSIFAISENKEIAQKVLHGMEKALQKNHIEYHSYISSINHSGIKVKKS